MPAAENGGERSAQAPQPAPESASPGEDETSADPISRADPGEPRRPPMKLSPMLLGALMVALIASAVSVGVVYKAARLQSEWERLRRAAADPAGMGHYAWANARLLGAKSYRPGEVTIVYGGAGGAAWETLAALQREKVHNRALPGQNTIQLLLRMEQDVLALQPRTMIFLPPLEGVQNPERTLLHTRLIGELAAGYGIRTVLATIPPIPMELDTVPGGYLGGLRATNQGLRKLAREEDWPLLEFYEPLVGEDFYLAPEYAGDTIWPNGQAYRQATDLLAALLDHLESGEGHGVPFEEPRSLAEGHRPPAGGAPQLVDETPRTAAVAGGPDSDPAH
jgi:hypothetical protein